MVEAKRKIIVIVALLAILGATSCKKAPQRQRKLTKSDLIELNNRFVRIDSTKIVEYSDSMNLNTTPTKSGLWMTITNEGDGEIIEKGNTVEILYTISDLYNNIYYSSDKDGNKRFAAGIGKEVIGLDEAILTLKQNSKATLILMPDKAFGLLGDEKRIVGRKILRYDIEVLKIDR